MTLAARQALAHVRARAGSAGAGPPGILQYARITVSFHPDRPVQGSTVVQLLARDGVYRSQFETGVSSGGLTAYPGGDRDRWEQRMFAGRTRAGRAPGGPSTAG